MNARNAGRLFLWLLASALLAILLWLGANRLKTSSPRIDISILNTGETVVRDMAVFYPNQDSAIGGLAAKFLDPSIRGTHVNYGFELPHQFRVEWKTPNGQMHKQLVTLPSREQITEPTHLIIAVDNDRVTLKIESIRVPND